MYARKRSPWKSILIALMIMLFMSGLALMMYPYIHGAIVDREIALNLIAEIARGNLIKNNAFTDTRLTINIVAIVLVRFTISLILSIGLLHFLYLFLSFFWVSYVSLFLISVYQTGVYCLVHFRTMCFCF